MNHSSQLFNHTGRKWTLFSSEVKYSSRLKANIIVTLHKLQIELRWARSIFNRQNDYIIESNSSMVFIGANRGKCLASGPTWSSFPSFPAAEDEINFASLKRKVRSSFASNFCTAFPLLRAITPSCRPLELLLALIPTIPCRSRGFVPRLIEFHCSFRSPGPIWRTPFSLDQFGSVQNGENIVNLSFVYCLVLPTRWCYV